jgi:hypothetical protein
MTQPLSLALLLFSLLLLQVINGPNALAQSDQCPRIYRDGSTLRTDSAQSYQWYRNGEAIPGANQQTYQPLGAPANYSVAVQGRASTPFIFDLSPMLNLVGQAFDEYLRPVANASISVGSRSTETDAQGRFQLNQLDNTPTILIRGEKAGHWTSQRRILQTGNLTHVQLMLRSQPFEHELNAESGGTISRGPFFLTLQPNGVLDANNQRYTGVVRIALNGGRPDDPNFGWMMPGGDFMAQDAQGRERMLLSYGFLSAHLQTPNGQPLKLDPNIGAQLRFVMPPSMVATAPDIMPLWHFDETSAIWKEEGFARRSGAAYVGTVRHFSSWNCDWPSERATVKGRYLDCKGRPIMNNPIRVGQVMTTTDSDGVYTSFVPSQIEFTVRSTSQNQTDTLQVKPLQPEVVENLSDLQGSGSGLYAFSVINTNNELTIHSYGTHGQVQYSIDNGSTYQTNNTFEVDINNNYQVIVKDSMDCPIMVNVARLGRKVACYQYDDISVEETPDFYSIREGLESSEPVYRFYLQSNSLTEFPQQIPDIFPCIIRLRLNNNRLTSLPESFGNLAQLQRASINDNQLTSLPESFGNLTHLIAVDLTNNRLTSLPESIGNLTNLRDLWLRGNPISPAEQARIRNLLPNCNIYF